ncbi:MAG: hypothetical protein AB7E31_13950 [Desulfitobacterium sp.]
MGAADATLNQGDRAIPKGMHRYEPHASTHGSICRGVPCQVYPRAELHLEAKGILLHIHNYEE